MVPGRNFDALLALVELAIADKLRADEKTGLVVLADCVLKQCSGARRAENGFRSDIAAFDCDQNRSVRLAGHDQNLGSVAGLVGFFIGNNLHRSLRSAPKRTFSGCGDPNVAFALYRPAFRRAGGCEYAVGTAARGNTQVCRHATACVGVHVSLTPDFAPFTSIAPIPGEELDVNGGCHRLVIVIARFNLETRVCGRLEKIAIGRDVQDEAAVSSDDPPGT